jgi:RND family efflux transporter MFP subunit
MSSAESDLSKLRIDRDAPADGLKRALWRNLILVAVAVLLVAAFMLVQRQRAAVEVQTIVVAAEGGGGGSTAGTSVTANGYVVARTRASVSAKVPGRLAYLPVSEGSFVRQNEVIARLSNEDYQAQVAQAEAQIGTTQADLLEAQAARAEAERALKRVQDIKQQQPQLISVQDVDAAETRFATADARAKAASARVASAEAAKRFAEAALENTLIRAPFTGTVLRKEAEVGEVVAPSVGGGLTRGAVVTMADLSTLEVEVDVNEAYIARVRRDQPARITLDAYPDTSFRGAVRQVVPTADRQRATVQVKVAITDHDPRILPEMGARVDFLEPEPPAGSVKAAEPVRIRVPAEAIQQRNGQSIVWLVREGKLQSRLVDAGPVSAGFREVRSGLSGGEQIVVSAPESAKDGLRVKATQSTPSSPR